VNGSEVDAKVGADGYARLERSWGRGDLVDLYFPMEGRLVDAHPWIESTRGCVAIERGPLVYCLEQADHPHALVPDLEIEATTALSSRWESDLLDGVAIVRASGFQVDTSTWDDRLYRPVWSGDAPTRSRVELTAVPYFAWANRGPGAMRVWIPRAASDVVASAGEA
jgi:DUF1680 family protein